MATDQQNTILQGTIDTGSFLGAWELPAINASYLFNGYVRQSAGQPKVFSVKVVRAHAGFFEGDSTTRDLEEDRDVLMSLLANDIAASCVAKGHDDIGQRMPYLAWASDDQVKDMMGQMVVLGLDHESHALGRILEMRKTPQELLEGHTKWIGR